MRRELISGFFIALVLGCIITVASEYPAPLPQSNPIPEPNFAGVQVLPPTPCSAENPYEQKLYAAQGWMQTDSNGNRIHFSNTDCQRLHFKFGPILVKPGQNDVLVQPLTIEKPAYDGYVVRFRPDLIWANPGKPGTFDVPPIQQVHLHHGTWLNLTNNYGNSAFAASGEEKTYFDMPGDHTNGVYFGFPVGGTDQWQILYMVHNLTSSTYTTWITYDTDYVSKASGDTAGIHTAYPIWLDVRNGSSYPVMNMQRSVAAQSPFDAFPPSSEVASTPSLLTLDATNSCSWPVQDCANFDPWGRSEATLPNQGEQGNLGAGNDAVQMPALGGSLGRIRNFTGGSLVWIGGHLHPGGLSDDIDLVRNGVSKPIFRSEAKYWDYTDNTQITYDRSKAVSWDVSLTVTGMPYWGIRLNPSDTIRINATYDNQVQSTYEDMGITVAMLAPDVPATNTSPAFRAPGIDPFSGTTNVIANTDPQPASGGQTAPPPEVSSLAAANCGPANNNLCEHGYVTHGSLAEAQSHSGPSGSLPANPTLLPPTTQVTIANFTYAPGSSDIANNTNSIMTVAQGSALTFTNLDAAADIYHTITSCAYPCQGPTGTAFPLANGLTSGGTNVDFDSGELGYGPSATAPFGQLGIGPAKNSATWTLNVDNTFKVGETYTYFCRIHPFMRGAFKVVAPSPPPALP